MTIAEQIILFNSKLHFNELLPPRFRVLNPFIENPETIDVMGQFYQKFYADTKPRNFIIGINPSRHGAGVTGVPFTDTKHLQSDCGIVMHSASTHEVSSVFLYDVIREMGGAQTFYQHYYINSPFPLALLQLNKKNNWVNANYYDDKDLFEAVKPYMIETLNSHFKLGLARDRVVVLGKKNANFIKKLNQETQLFDQMEVLEHPRFIQQYKSKDRQLFIEKFVRVLSETSK